MKKAKKIETVVEKDYCILISNNDISPIIYYTATPHLRYMKKVNHINENTCKEELMLQQMHQGSDGSQKWEWVEVVE